MVCKMYSQRNEEKYIIGFFKGYKTGRFLDIGAYDGKTFSNTRQLALQGWRGVLVEPSPSVTGALEKLYEDNNRFEILKVGIGKKDGIFPFYNFDGDAIGSFDKKHADFWAIKARPYKIIQIEVISVETLFERVGFDFDFINIDVEGWSVQLLSVLDFNKLKNLRMICVEFEHKVDLVKSLVVGHGFKFLQRTSENLIMVR